MPGFARLPASQRFAADHGFRLSFAAIVSLLGPTRKIEQGHLQISAVRMELPQGYVTGVRSQGSQAVSSVVFHRCLDTPSCPAIIFSFSTPVFLPLLFFSCSTGSRPSQRTSQAPFPAAGVGEAQEGQTFPVFLMGSRRLKAFDGPRRQ